MFHRSVLALSALTLGSSAIWAQTKPGGADSPAKNEDDESLVVLSPFVVTAGEDANTYKANSTLAGSRVRTDLKDVASSLSVVTAEFLRDTGATNNQTLLQYTTNTEVAGIYGNMAGVGSTYINGATESATNLLRPATNTRVRGLDSADNTRDYFQTDIPWDSFNVGRVDLQRGPNSILFGIGSPAGIINASANTAGYKTEGKVENRLGSFGSARSSFDYNYVVVPEQLSVRVASLYDDTQYRQKPAYNLDRRLFAAARWDPKLFENGHTTIRASYEGGDVKANRPRTLPPIDKITPYFDPNGFNKQLQDATFTTQMGIQPFSSSTLSPGQKANYWFGGSMGVSGGAAPVFTYDNNSTPTSVHAGGNTTYFAIGKDGTRSGSIGGFPYSQQVGIAGYATYAYNLAQYGASHGATAAQVASVAGATQGFFKDKSITDTGIYDFYNNLLDGNTKKEWQNWKAYNASLEQTFFHDRLGFQVVYDRQYYHDGSESNLGYSTFLSVDINAYTYQYPGAYNAANGYNGEVSAKTNPNAGRVYTGAGSPGGSSRSTDRENVRATAFGELRAKDFLDDTLLAKIIGHHTVTGVYSEETYKIEDRSWTRYALTDSWNDLIGKGPDYGGTAGGLSSGARTVSNLTYLTGSVAGYDSASQLGISRIMADQSPSGSYSAKYYDSHWKWSLNPSASDYVNPNAPWTNPTYRPDNTGTDTQSSNPANYVGWKDTTVSVMNADQGDINSLYTAASKTKHMTTSEGLTLQSYLWEDTLVGTFGWRRDKQKIRAGAATVDHITGIADMNYGIDPLDPDTGVTTGDSKSWGLVLHTPKKLSAMLPWKSDVSLAFSNGNNSRVENRYGFNGKKLANSKGSTNDYSIIFNTLNDRLTFKATYYDTKVKDANLSSVTTQTSTLGANTNELVEGEVYGTTSALIDLGGNAGDDKGNEWYWNWATVSHGFDGAYNDPTTALYNNDPETIKQKAAVASWLAQMQPQSWFDAFGYKVDVAKAKAGDYKHAINGGIWQPPSYVNNDLGSNNGGKVNGQWPTGTVDYESKGWEFEITGQPTKNWNVSLNASKQMAQQTALGADLVATVEAMYKKYQSPAGDLRRWWGGDETFRAVFNRDVYSAYLFQKNTNGKMVSEMAPWRFNLVTNYKFDRALLKGFNVGGGYRWEDHKILGYALNATQDNLDVTKPYWSKPDDAVDLWAGYERKISSKLDWRVQLNLRDVGKKPHVTPISVEPDGSYAQYRIQEGMTWTVTNTFSF
jgi:outer membrane receptor for ferric coprogen and ferric-rhodotorulic acid